MRPYRRSFPVQGSLPMLIFSNYCCPDFTKSKGNFREQEASLGAKRTTGHLDTKAHAILYHLPTGHSSYPVAEQRLLLSTDEEAETQTAL